MYQGVTPQRTRRPAGEGWGGAPGAAGAGKKRLERRHKDSLPPLYHKCPRLCTHFQKKFPRLRCIDGGGRGHTVDSEVITVRNEQKFSNQCPENKQGMDNKKGPEAKKGPESKKQSGYENKNPMNQSR